MEHASIQVRSGVARCAFGPSGWAPSVGGPSKWRVASVHACDRSLRHFMEAFFERHSLLVYANASAHSGIAHIMAKCALHGGSNCP